MPLTHFRAEVSKCMHVTSEMAFVMVIKNMHINKVLQQFHSTLDLLIIVLELLFCHMHVYH